ncbi:hypothetical protein Acr_16g0006080 [Actinidia rufa]|uniref:Uncharacterized protein n=1 Tax=Actinidia rufa TaxID=165716 RepID=A0A7J0FZI9_9ERIC|nr:hypothetical protein Acr_16g0006080 [Actinidia rufa]
MFKKALLAWDDICLPKKEGDLGFKNLEAWNLALLSRNLWNISAKKDTLWVRWMHQNYLQNSCIWDYNGYKQNSNLIKHVLNVRDKVLTEEGSIQAAKSRVDITPRHSFILWLGLKDRLQTRDKLQELIEEKVCPPSSTADETIDHFVLSMCYRKSVPVDAARCIYGSLCCCCNVSGYQRLASALLLGRCRAQIIHHQCATLSCYSDGWLLACCISHIDAMSDANAPVIPFGSPPSRCSLWILPSSRFLVPSGSIGIQVKNKSSLLLMLLVVAWGLVAMFEWLCAAASLGLVSGWLMLRLLDWAAVGSLLPGLIQLSCSSGSKLIISQTSSFMVCWLVSVHQGCILFNPMLMLGLVFPDSLYDFVFCWLVSLFAPTLEAA